MARYLSDPRAYQYAEDPFVARRQAEFAYNDHRMHGGNVSPAQAEWNRRQSEKRTNIRINHAHSHSLWKAQAEQHDARMEHHRIQRDNDERYRYRAHPGGVHAVIRRLCPNPLLLEPLLFWLLISVSCFLGFSGAIHYERSVRFIRKSDTHRG